MNQIMKMANEEIVTMTSLEVVELINNFRLEEGVSTLKKHDVLLRDIRIEIKMLKDAGVQGVNNFVESTYINSQNKVQPCYKMNKAGIMQMLNKESALVRYKTQQYIDALEAELRVNRFNPYENLSKELQAIIALDMRQQEVDKKVENVVADVIDLRENAPLYNIECDEISKRVRNVGVRILGGKKSEAYADKSLRAQVYTDIYQQLKRQFGVTSYKAIKRGQLHRAYEIIENYEAPIVLQDEIEMANRQLALA